MNLYYVNSKGERLNFYDYPYLFQEGNLLDYSYSYTSINGFNFNEIKSIKKDVQERTIKIAIMADISLPLKEREEKYKQAANHLQDIIEYDVATGNNGRIYTDSGAYLECQILGSSKIHWETRSLFMFNTLKVVIPNYTWIVEESIEVFRKEEVSQSGLDFPTDFSFDFATGNIGEKTWHIDHYKPSHFKMIIFGPCENPKVMINEYPYQVFVELKKGEYIIVDSKSSTVIKKMIDGTEINAYNSRQFYPSIFNKIPSGYLTINWPGNFGFNITLYLERNEPKW